MSGNRAVAYKGPGVVEVIDIDYPSFELKDGPGVNPANVGRKVPHGVILKTVTTNICGSDQHMVRGRTTAPTDLILGHEITGEVVEAGPDVEFINVGDIVSVPFNIACGRCRNCKEGKTGICLNVNPDRPGSAYGYVDMGGWVGGQAEYVLVPYADWNVLKFPDRDQALEKILDLTMLSDIFPTGFHGAVTAGVGVGSTVYVAGAGPVGLAAAASAQLLGAAVVIVGDLNDDRLAQARSFGCETINVGDGSVPDQLEQLLGRARGRCRRRCRRFRGPQRGPRRQRRRSARNSAELADGRHRRRRRDRHSRVSTSPATQVPSTTPRRSVPLSLSLGTGWAKSLSFTTGQCPVMKYNRQLMMAILHDKVQIADAVNAKAITLEDAPRGYAEFDAGAATKYVLNPHGYVSA